MMYRKVELGYKYVYDENKKAKYSNMYVYVCMYRFQMYLSNIYIWNNKRQQQQNKK